MLGLSKWAIRGVFFFQVPNGWIQTCVHENRNRLHCQPCHNQCPTQLTKTLNGFDQTSYGRSQNELRPCITIEESSLLILC